MMRKNNPQLQGWDLNHGELMTFANPGFDLSPINRLETFNLNGRSMYQMALLAIGSLNCLYACWTYYGFDHLFRGYVCLSGY